MTAALSRERVTGARGELDGIVRELYDTLAHNRCGIKLIDRSAPDLPDLAALWFDGARGGLIDALATYLADRTRRKLFRPFPDHTVTARMLIETIVFWAVHRIGTRTRRPSTTRSRATPSSTSSSGRS